MMSAPKIFESEFRFCLILWENEPIKSGELVALCRQRLGWKPTTYTVIKRLSECGVLKNENSGIFGGRHLRCLGIFVAQIADGGLVLLDLGETPHLLVKTVIRLVIVAHTDLTDQRGTAALFGPKGVIHSLR